VRTILPSTRDGTLIAAASPSQEKDVFKEGSGLRRAERNNFVTGFAMIMKTKRKAAVPFEEYMAHDHCCVVQRPARRHRV
jgi:hypothetical protein